MFFLGLVSIGFAFFMWVCWVLLREKGEDFIVDFNSRLLGFDWMLHVVFIFYVGMLPFHSKIEAVDVDFDFGLLGSGLTLHLGLFYA